MEIYCDQQKSHVDGELNKFLRMFLLVDIGRRHCSSGEEFREIYSYRRVRLPLVLRTRENLVKLNYPS